jgi:hypothetical protein
VKVVMFVMYHFSSKSGKRSELIHEPEIISKELGNNLIVF